MVETSPVLSKDLTDSSLSKIVHLILTNKKILILVCIILIGAILRYLVATHVAPVADEMIHGTHSIGIIKAGVINLQNEGPAWSYLTDIAYTLFGVNAFSGRFLSFFFGTFTILLVYLLGRELFSEKIALIAASLFALSAFHIRYALMEMDEAMIFFVLLAFYCFARDLRYHQRFSLLAAVSMGIAILIKPIALPFLLGFAIAFYYMPESKDKKKTIMHANKKQLLIIALILLLFALPVLAFNYILYTQKGISDVLFSRFLGVNQGIYASLQGYNTSFSISYLLSAGITSFVRYLFLPHDPAIFILGLFGVAAFFIKKEYGEYGKPFLMFHIIPIIFLLGTSLLPTHFVSFMPLFSLSAAAFIALVAERLSVRVSPRKLIIGTIIVVAIINFYILLPYLTSTSAFFKMRDFAVTSVADQNIVIADTRIYRGRIAWMFNDKAYIEASYLPQLLTLNQNLSGDQRPTTMYFVECAYRDDCGWGTINSQPELNATMENMVEFFKNNPHDETTITGGGGYAEDTGKPYFVIYKVTADISPRLYPLIYETHEWFYYPVRWAKSDWYDKYTPQGIIQNTLHLLGKIMLWLAVILALLSPIFVVNEFLRPQLTV